MTTIAVDGREVWSRNAVMVEAFIERLDAHRLNARRDQFTDRVIDHRGSYAGVQAKTIGEVRGDVVLAATHVNLTLMSFAKRNQSRIEPVDQRAQRKKVQRAFCRHAEPVCLRVIYAVGQ